MFAGIRNFPFMPVSDMIRLLQQKDGSYAFTVDVSLLTPEKLRKIADAVEKYASYVKFTESQRMLVFGIKAEDAEKFCREAEVKPAPGKGVKSVKWCPPECIFSLQDARAMAERLENLKGMELPANMKIAVSGCPNSCTEAQVRDIGLMGKKNGFTLYVGGCVGKNPRIGRVLKDKLGYDEAEELVRKIVEVYKDKAEEGERLGKFIERYGWENFLKELGI